MTYHIALFPHCKRTTLSERRDAKLDIDRYRILPPGDPNRMHRVHQHAAHGPPPIRAHTLRDTRTL
ncbi:hypothetical protein FJY94_00510 [Candidatus Kaiserbacteria bacterium]|nr:hypothetical protein [Candidatus Kaiserbacteria bacterium]